jgi:sarcosine oxidase
LWRVRADLGVDCESLKHFDAIVVGCGAMGSSVSYSLASRGLRVLTLERFGLNHEFGSSHGMTRITRLAYFEDPRYVPLLRRSFAAWDELAKRSGTEVLRRTGGLMIGREEGRLVSGVLKSAAVHSLAHRRLDAREVMNQYGAFKLEDDHCAVYEDSAGVLFPDRCISSFVGVAEESGCEFRFSERVTRWRPHPESVEVETEKGVYEADKLIFSAGAWTSDLLPGLLPLKCERQVQFWFKPPEDGLLSAGRTPIFIMEEDSTHYFYGIPDVGHGVKVARTHGGTPVNPEGMSRGVTEGDLAPVKGFIRRRLPGLDPSPIASAPCIYTNTPDSNFVIDFHPQDERVLVISACSGHGFKFSSVIGEVAADMITEGRSKLDVSFLRIGRFSEK